MIEKIKNNIWRFKFKLFGSHVYLIKLQNKEILIDTSSEENKKELIQNLKELKLNPKQIDIVILTHNHPDHVGNVNLFENAKIYGSRKDFSEKEISDTKKLKMKGLEIIETPGHSEGGICVYLPEEKVLFSGDTLFGKGLVGRTDLEGSSHKKLIKSLEKLKKVDYKILCPGHGIIES